MPTSIPATTSRRRARRLATCLGVAALVATPLVVVGQGSAGAAAPVLKSANVPSYPAVVENSTSHTLYILSTEKGAKLHCTSSACLAAWHPLEVKSSVKKVAVASAVKGKVGFVKRSATMKQVTLNTYPLYTFSGDKGANEATGEAVAADGGTWHLVHAAAKTAATTADNPALIAANIPAYNGILENTSARSLYILSTEKGATLKCTSSSCLQTWPPLLVPTATTSVTFGAGVKGTIGFVTRSATEKQVTYNSYPVYTFSNDTGPNQSSGQGVAADGGTWTLVTASATTAAATPVSGGSSGGGW